MTPLAGMYDAVVSKEFLVMDVAPARRIGRPSLEEAAALQKTILDGALRMVSAAGTEGFSVDRLASHISVTKRTIYRHYKSKDNLIVAVVERELQRITSEVETVSLPRGDQYENETEALRLWIKRLFDYISRPEVIVFINFLKFESVSSPAISREFVKWHTHVLSHACRLIANAQDQGYIRAGNCRRFGLLLLDLVAGIQTRIRPGSDEADMFGGDSSEQFFEFRWMGFLSLVSNHPWGTFINLRDSID